MSSTGQEGHGFRFLGAMITDSCRHCNLGPDASPRSLIYEVRLKTREDTSILSSKEKVLNSIKWREVPGRDGKKSKIGP